ncbi:unnamed protein product [Pieris brassicae]|uniref:Uncharacterized protein n=1 Tax=Pieris brassicae TaxID=7116 RepID=A0A9P0TGZ2_PIEBR|nr:unnamed protein product [Pieris brassicae]
MLLHISDTLSNIESFEDRQSIYLVLSDTITILMECCKILFSLAGESCLSGIDASTGINGRSLRAGSAVTYCHSMATKDYLTERLQAILPVHNSSNAFFGNKAHCDETYQADG